MKNIFKFKKPHLHLFLKPILSRYLSFNCRSIIYECRCGKRKAKTVCKEFDEPFPIETTDLITNEEFESAINKTLKQDETN